MTISAPVYTATLQGSSPVALAILDGSITLDEATAPHVQGSITIALPSATVLAALDPRTSPPPRISVIVTVTLPWSTVTRAFDLTLRGRTVRHAEGAVVLSLSSDEGLLQDIAPLADDLNPYTYEASLRGVVGYVLGKIGATLAATPATDADVTPYASATNLVTDPSCQGGATIYTVANATLDRADTSWAAVGTKCINIYAPTSADSYATIGGDNGAIRMGMTAGRTYVCSATGKVKTGYPVGGTPSVNARRIVAYWRVGTGAYASASSPQLPTTTTAGTRVAVTFTIPADATEAFVRVYNGHTTGEVQWDAFRLSEYTGDPADAAYFDGATAPTPGYAYAWTGTPDASTSTRRALISRSIDSLTWKAGTDGYEFLNPLVQAAGLRLVCDESRTWTLRSGDYQADGSLAIRHAVNLVDGDDAIVRADTDPQAWFDACVVVYTWTDADGATLTAFDTAQASSSPSRIIRLARDTPYPGPGFAAYAVARAKGRGRALTLTTMADWTARAEQPIQAILDRTPTQIGKTSRVVYDLGRHEMTVTTRTTDTPPSAWTLIPVGERWIDSPTGASWTAESI